MIQKVYFQKSPTTGYPIDPNVFSAWFGFEKKMGVETVGFTWAQLRDGEIELARDAAVVGGIQAVRLALEQLGFEPPANIDYPDCLEPFLRRRVRQTTIRQVHQLCVEDQVVPPVFVKPAAGHKDFDGHVVRAYRDLIRTAGWLTAAPNTAVWVSEVVGWVSECRYFVSRGRVIGVGHYKGDPLVLPDGATVARAVDVFGASGEAPAAYTIDFGVLASGESALVEVNDGFAFGSYGLSPILHARMIEDRWSEMVGLPMAIR